MNTRITSLHILIASLFLFIATTMTFINAVNADFVNWDDDVYVTENPHVQTLSLENIGWIFSHTYYYSWIPATLLSHAVDVAIWGMNSKGHHLTNVVLHSCNAVFFFVLCLTFFVAIDEEHKEAQSLRARLSPSVFVGSAIAALLYAMHPLRVESVSWISGRKDLLCAFFLLPAFISYLVWKLRRREASLVATHILFALALLAKPMAAAAPMILVLVDVWWIKKSQARINLFDRIVEGKVLLFAMSAIAALVTILAVPEGRVNVVGELSLAERFLLPPYAIMFYLWKLVIPLDLSPVYPDFGGVMPYLAPLMFVGIAYTCFVLMGKQYNGASLAFFSYLLILFPTFIGLSSGLQPLADRYTYLATMPLFMFVGGCVEWSWRKSSTSSGRFYQRELIVAILLVLCGINAFRSIRHLAIWDNSISLWSQSVRYAPATRDEYRARAPYIKPNYLDAYLNLGTAYYATNDKDKAIEQFRQALVLDDRCADAHYDLGNVLFEKGDRKGAVRSFQNAVASDPQYAKAHYNLGIVYANQDSVEAAVRSFRTAARLGLTDAQKILRERGYAW